MPFNIQVEIDKTAAILAGNSKFGVREYEVTDAFLEKCALPLREALVDLHDSQQALGPLAIATEESVLGALIVYSANREQQKLEEAAAKAKAVMDEAMDQARAVKLKLALHKWIKEHGSETQKNRFKEGLFPEKEILTLVKNDLFSDYDHLNEYEPMAIAEFCECGEGAFQKAEAKYLRDTQYEFLETVREESPKGAIITVWDHRGHCETCKGDALKQSIRISIPWANTTLRRDYALPR